MNFVRRMLSVLARLSRIFTGPFLYVALRPGVLFRKTRKAVALVDSKCILVVNPSNIGDLVLATPFLRGLRESAPKAKIVLVVQHQVSGLFACSPFVDEVLPFDDAFGQRLGRARLAARTIMFVFRLMRGLKPDYAILQPNDAAFAMAYLTGATRRVSYSQNDAIGSRFSDMLLTDVVPTAPASMHEVERNLHLLSWLGGSWSSTTVSLSPSVVDFTVADRVLSQANAIPARWIALGANEGTRPLRAWPMEHYKELIDSTEKGTGFVLVGGSADRAMYERLIAAVDIRARPIINCAGELALLETAAVIARSRRFIGSDSACMHMAAAVGTETVAVFGASCPHLYGPWTDNSVVFHASLPCGPCAFEVGIQHRGSCATCIYGAAKCMEMITPRAVIDVLSRPRVPRALIEITEQPALEPLVMGSRQ